MSDQSLCKSGRIRITEFDISDPLFRPVRDIYVPPVEPKQQPGKNQDTSVALTLCSLLAVAAGILDVVASGVSL